MTICECGKEFVKRQANQRWCSYNCDAKAREEKRKSIQHRQNRRQRIFNSILDLYHKYKNCSDAKFTTGLRKIMEKVH